MLIKPSIILAAAVLAAASLLSPFARADGTDPLMPTGTTFDPNPAAPNSPTNQVLVYGTDKDGTAVPMKTLSITNNTPNTVYPIMRDQNATVCPENQALGLYDPYDTPKREYRGYIGYQGTDKKYYYGLKRNQTILVSIPLVFWDAARMGIETGGGGQYLLNNETKLPNPLRNDSNAARTIAKSVAGPGVIDNGVVMWYRSDTPTLAVAPADDTEDQLVEWTVRDHVYLSNPKVTEKTKGTNGKSQIPDNQLVTLINYDVSNVDSLYLPVAMEALDVWVVPQGAGEGEDANRNGWKPGSDAEPYGWTGSTKDANFLQPLIGKFIADGTTAQPNSLLGQYFGGKGWPYYNFPGVETDKKMMIKIPSGANIFPQSPILDVRSSYSDGVSWQLNKYMLSSGGTDPVFVTIGWAGGTPDQSGSTTLHINLIESDKIAFIKPGYLVTGVPPDSPPTPNPIKAGTTVTGVDIKAGTVTLSQPLIASSAACAFTFTRPIDDYAASAMIRLWYSWAQYYLAHWRDNTPSAPMAAKQIAGSIEANTATLFFNEEHPELVEGMAVTGPGLDDAQTEVGIHQGDAVILKIASKKSVILSQVVKTASTNAPFTFSPPKPLLWTPTAKGDPGYPLIVGDQFQFSGEPAWHDPYAFSQQVYLIMASINQISLSNNNNVCKFMQDVIGANMGFIFTQAAKDSDDGKMVSAMIRDMIKSVLRGVSDFTKYPDVVNNQGKHTSWYPDPSEPHGKQLFNVFNLDPFVWFIHVQLGFSGYGFSVDDDTADVGAGGASQLQVTITGEHELQNTSPWTIQAPYGPVKNVSLQYSGPQTVPDEGNTLYNAIASVSNDTPIKITTTDPHHLSTGALVRIDQVKPDPDTNAANGIFKIGDVTTKTFDLFNKDTGSPISPNTACTPNTGRWSYYPPHPYIDSGGGADLTKVFYRVTGDDALGTFQGTRVRVNGVDQNKDGRKFRVWQRGLLDKGRLLLDADLTDKTGTSLRAGTYEFTFFGVEETGKALGASPPLPGRR